MFYAYIIISTLCFLVGDYLSKLWISNKNWELLAIALIIFLAASTFFILALKKTDSLSLTILFSTLFGLLGGIFVGHVFFAEKLNLPQYFGLGFAILAIVLLVFPFQILEK